MSRRLASPLSEPLELFEGQIIAVQMQEAIDEHGHMASTEDKSIPVMPLGLRGIEVEEVLPEYECRVSTSHDTAWMS